jgi:hypothetical protein
LIFGGWGDLAHRRACSAMMLFSCVCSPNPSPTEQNIAQMQRDRPQYEAALAAAKADRDAARALFDNNTSARDQASAALAAKKRSMEAAKARFLCVFAWHACVCA